MRWEGASLQIDPKSDNNRARIAALALAIMLMLAGLAWLLVWPESLLRILETIRASVWARVSGLLSERMLELALMAVLVLALEVLVVGWRKSSVFRLGFRPRYTALIDILVFVSTLLSLGGIIAVLLTFGLSVATSRLVNWILSQYGWSRIDLPSDGILQVAAGFSIYWLTITFFEYWGHRLMHTPLLWHLHRFHHAATELNIITGLRQHPLEPVILGFLALVSPLVFFNVSDEILLIYLVWGTTFDLLGHSQLPWGYAWFGRWIVASPCVHQIHHSAADEHRDMHFSKCPLWDHLFGTWYKGANAPSEYGIPDNQYEARPIRQFVFDAAAFYRTALQGLLGWLASRTRIAD